jgi:hypothetical protein
MNINTTARIISRVDDKVIMLETYCKVIVALSSIIYLGMLELINTESFLN